MRIFVLFLILFCSGCSAVKNDETLTWSQQKLYTEAKTALDAGNYDTSRRYYDKILARYPFSSYAQQSTLDLISLEYKDREYDKSMAQANKFIQLYPNNPYVDYARYMKGVISYSRDISVVDKIVPTNIAQSDQTIMQQAFYEFDNLIKLSPKGEYTEDAKQRMLFLRNITAEHEIYVAIFYMQKQAFLASANRGKYVLENFATTPSVPYALAVMVRSYQELGEKKLSEDSKKVLELNFAKLVKDDEQIKDILYGDVTKQKSFFSKLTKTLHTN